MDFSGIVYRANKNLWVILLPHKISLYIIKLDCFLLCVRFSSKLDVLIDYSVSFRIEKKTIDFDF